MNRFKNPTGLDTLIVISHCSPLFLSTPNLSLKDRMASRCKALLSVRIRAVIVPEQGGSDTRNYMSVLFKTNF